MNIPDTQDTGTFDIGKILNNDILDFIFKTVFPITRIQNYLESDFAQTQDLDITEQLENGIRYFDLRLALNENDYEVWKFFTKSISMLTFFYLFIYLFIYLLFDYFEFLISFQMHTSSRAEVL